VSSTNNNFERYGRAMSDDEPMPTTELPGPPTSFQNTPPTLAVSQTPGRSATPPPVSPKAVEKRYQLLRLVSIAAALIFTLAGAVFWYLGLANLPVPVAVAPVPVATPMPEPALQAYNQARESFAAQRFEEAIPNFEKVVVLNPAYSNNSLAYLFVTYREAADRQLANKAALKQALETLTKATNLAEKQADLLTTQLSKSPLLPIRFNSPALFIKETVSYRRWIENYLTGLSLGPDTNGPEWFKGAIEAWASVYKEKPDFLAQLGGDALATRLFVVYGEKANYSCIKGNLTEALAALDEQLNVIKTSSAFGEQKAQKSTEVMGRRSQFETTKCVAK